MVSGSDSEASASVVVEEGQILCICDLCPSVSVKVQFNPSVSVSNFKKHLESRRHRDRLSMFLAAQEIRGLSDEASDQVPVRRRPDVGMGGSDDP